MISIAVREVLMLDLLDIVGSLEERLRFQGGLRDGLRELTDREALLEGSANAQRFTKLR
jgi:hypothetical protein